MERVCFLLQVRPDKLEEYKERHKAVWDDMQQALRETGWHNYSLFLRDDGLLVGYFETPDYAAALAGMAEREVNERWQREMGQQGTGSHQNSSRVALHRLLPAGRPPVDLRAIPAR